METFTLFLGRSKNIKIKDEGKDKTKDGED